MRIRTALLIILLSVAAFVRLYRIEELTEFLGDQGSAGVVIYESVQTRTLPLVGPKVSTGQRPGPFYYYLIAGPLLLSRFNPVAGAIFFALLGVLSVWFLYVIGSKMFDTSTGIVIASLYALSPVMITQNRTMWNPTAIPFLIILLVFAMYKMHNEQKLHYVILAGLCNGLLIQLHYTTVFTIVITFIFWISTITAKKNHGRNFSKWTGLGLLTFVLPLLPFMYYEYIHGFIDLRRLLEVFVFPQGDQSMAYPYPLQLIKVITRSWYLALPLTSNVWGTVLLAGIIFVPIVFMPNFWHVWMLLWLTLSVFGRAFFSGVIFDHYLYSLVPLYFLLIAGFFFTIVKKVPSLRMVWYVLISFLLLFYVSQLDIFSEGSRDIPRTRSVVNEILDETGLDTYSFTLFSSRSYSDYHYRFFFLTKRSKPIAITDPSYTWLFVVCEWGECPSEPAMNAKTTIQALCYDHHCEGVYPTIPLSGFTLTSMHCFNDAILYSFKRLPVNSL